LERGDQLGHLFFGRDRAVVPLGGAHGLRRGRGVEEAPRETPRSADAPAPGRGPLRRRLPLLRPPRQQALQLVLVAVEAQLSEDRPEALQREAVRAGGLKIELHWHVAPEGHQLAREGQLRRGLAELLPALALDLVRA